MKKTVGKLLIIAGILILAGMMLNGREGFSFFGFDDESARTYHAQAKDIDKLDIDAKSITVNIQAENRDDIKAEISGKNVRLDSSEQGRTLRLSADSKGFWPFFWNKKELIVKIPSEYKEDLSISSGSGNVKLSGGGLHLRNVALKSGSGSLKADDLQAEDLSVKGTSGSVRLENVQTAAADIRSTSGNTKLENVTGRLSIKQTSGNLRASFAEINDSLSIKQTSGNTNLKLPDDADISLKAESTSGNISHSYSFDQVANEKRTLTGKKGNGKNKIDISITSGNVSIE